MIRIDQEKCRNCMACFDVCRANVYVDQSDDNGKTVAVMHPDECFRCGYCLSVCPVNAILHDEISKADFIEIPAFTIKPDDMKNLMYSRRSTKCFKNKSVPDEMIKQILDVAVHAGTGGNLQLENIIVIRNREYLQKLEKLVIDVMWKGGIRFFSGHGILFKILTRIYGEKWSKAFTGYHNNIERWKASNDFNGKALYHAPVVIVMHGLKSSKINQANCAIAIRNMELLAETMGLASCWSGWLMAASGMSGKINKFLGLDKSRAIGGALMIGYPEYKNKYKVPRDARDVKWI